MPELSNCHQAPVTIGGDDTDGTHYYVCSSCHNSCNLMPVPSEAQSITNDTSSGTEYQNEEIMTHEAQDDRTVKESLTPVEKLKPSKSTELEAQTEDELEQILKNMVEDTVMFLTNDLPSLLEQDRVAQIRRVHKDEVLKNLPKTKQAILAWHNRLVEEAVKEIRNELAKLQGTTIKNGVEVVAKYDVDASIEVALERLAELKQSEGTVK